MGGWIELGILVFVLTAAISAAWASWRAAPYVPTWGSDVQRLLDLAEVKAGERVVDLGSGDGRIVLAAAKRGATATGYEISVLPYLVSILRRLWSPVRMRTAFRFVDLFHADLQSVDVVIVFLLPSSVKKLVPKFQAELRPGQGSSRTPFK